MIISIEALPNREAFYCDTLEEGLSMLAVNHRAVLRLLQHPGTGEIRVPSTPKKLLNLVTHLVKTKQLPNTTIHTQKAVFEGKVVTGVRIKSFARKADEYIFSWPGGDLRIRFHQNATRGLFYFFYQHGGNQ